MATRFHVYTTKGTMQQVSQHASAYTASWKEKFIAHSGDVAVQGKLNPDFIHTMHSNIIHTTNATFLGAQGQVDCETARSADGTDVHTPTWTASTRVTRSSWLLLVIAMTQ